MIKKILLLFAFAAIFVEIVSAASFRSGTQPLVDGVFNPTQVVITGRNPIFSWEYTSVVSSFTVIISSDAVTFEPAGEFWNLEATTTTANTSSGLAGLTTRIAYSGATPLAANTTYYWKVSLYDGVTPASAAGQFSTVSAASALAAPALDLLVDWNNPFDPYSGGYTVFRYTTADRDRTLKVRVFNVAGDLVRDWPEASAMRGAVYSVNWDGRSNDGVLAARGVYFANVVDVSDNTGITKRVFVIK